MRYHTSGKRYFHIGFSFCTIRPHCAVHHGEEITQLVEEHGNELFYLPTYSLDFNLIEYLFAKIKAFVKGLRPITMPNLLQAFVDGVLNVTAKAAAETFRHCGNC